MRAHTCAVQPAPASLRPRSGGSRELAWLAGYWFAMTASLGVYLPYFSLYLREGLGFTGAQVGLTFAVPPLMGMLAQPLWGQVGDRTGSRTRVLACLSLGSALGYLVLGWPRTFAPMLLATAFLSFFSTSQIPMAVAVTMSGLMRAGGASFGHIRVFGTIGFLLTVLLVPSLLSLHPGFDPQQQSESLHVTFYVAAGLAACAALIALLLPGTGGSDSLRASRSDYRLLLRNGPYLRVLLISFGAFFFLQGPIVLFPVFVRARGGDAQVIAHMWLWMLALEIGLLFAAGLVYRKLGPRHSIALGVIAGGVRFGACALSHDLRFLYPLQMLHGVMVFSLQVAAPTWVEALVPGRLRGTSQAGLTMLGASIGGILSSTLAGFLLDARGIDAVFLCAGAGGVALGISSLWLLPKDASTGPTEQALP